MYVWVWVCDRISPLLVPIDVNAILATHSLQEFAQYVFESVTEWLLFFISILYYYDLFVSKALGKTIGSFILFYLPTHRTEYGSAMKYESIKRIKWIVE